jgi:hypothetical protein
MKIIILAVLISVLVLITDNITSMSTANSNSIPDSTQYKDTSRYGVQNVPLVLQPLIKLDKKKLDIWINAEKYPSDKMNNPEIGLEVPEDFYDFT